MVDTRDELEHIDLEPAVSATVQRRRWPRRRVVVLLTTVALVGVLLGPVRTSALKGGFRHLERIFLESQAVSRARADGYSAVFRRAVYDQARLTAAAGRLYEAEEARNAELRRQLDDDIRVRFDGGLRRLRAALEPVIRRDPSFVELERARQLLAATRARFGLAPARIRPVSLMTAIAGDLQGLSRYFDSPTHTRLVVATSQGVFEIDIDAGRTRRLATRPDELGRAPDGAPVTEVDGQGGFRVRDADTGRTIARHEGFPIAAHGTLILRTSDRGDGNLESAAVIDARSGREVARIPIDQAIAGAAFSPDGSLLAVAGTASVRILDVDDGEIREVPRNFDSTVGPIVWSPNGNFVFYGFYSAGAITAWDIAQARPTLLRLGDDLGGNITGLVALPA